MRLDRHSGAFKEEKFHLELRGILIVTKSDSSEAEFLDKSHCKFKINWKVHPQWFPYYQLMSNLLKFEVNYQFNHL